MENTMKKAHHKLAIKYATIFLSPDALLRIAPFSN